MLINEDVQSKLGIHQRAVCYFLDVLFVLKFFRRESISTEGVYYNTMQSQTFLSEKIPTNVCALFKMGAIRTNHLWGRLTDSLRTGKKQNNGSDTFETFYSDTKRMKGFLKAMLSVNGRANSVFARKFSFEKYNTLLDVGGALGNMSCGVAKHKEHMSCITMDLRPVEAKALKYVNLKAVGHRVNEIYGNFSSRKHL